MDGGDFSEKSGLAGGLRTFDAFPKTKTSYTTRHARGGQWTVFLLLTCALLSLSELRRWYSGQESHQFMVEKGVGHTMQINLDIVVAMHCSDLDVNVQDASGDRILAGQMLKRDETSWAAWRNAKGLHTLGVSSTVDHHDPRHHHAEGDDNDESEHAAHVMGLAAGGKTTFQKTPRLRGGHDGACRIYGSMEVNRVQGDFHITARGHGYMEFGAHLDHSAFNFSHIINELSFGPFYPSLHNPLDSTIAQTPAHFFKFQYYLSIVPTLYRSSRHRRTLSTNQYAVTEQSMLIGERSVPGIFFKFDLEPIMLLITDHRSSFLRLLVRLVNVLSGVLVAGSWSYQILVVDGFAALILPGRWSSSLTAAGRRRRRGLSEGVLHGRTVDGEDDEE